MVDIKTYLHITQRVLSFGLKRRFLIRFDELFLAIDSTPDEALKNEH